MGSLRDDNFWNEHYALELKNFGENGDEGDIWFGKKLTKEIIGWILTKFPSSHQSKMSIVDIGCGNAFLLCELATNYNKSLVISHKNLTLDLLGLDYSENSIILSDKIVSSRKLDNIVQLKQCDFLNHSQVLSAINGKTFDYIVDKGTYDAICLLAEDNPIKLQESKIAYMKSLHSMVKPGSIFFMASCNNTKDELMELMKIESTNGIVSTLIDQIHMPTIKFGGITGSQVTCLIFAFDKL